MLNEFVEELKHNQNINYKNNLENRIDIDYVLERLEDIQEIKNSDPIDYILGIFNELEKMDQYDLLYNACENLRSNVENEAKKEIKNDNGYHNTKLKALEKELRELEEVTNILYK